MRIRTKNWTESNYNKKKPRCIVQICGLDFKQMRTTRTANFDVFVTQLNICRSVYYLIGIYWLLIFRIFHPTHYANWVKYKCVNLGNQDAVLQIAKFKTEWYKRILSILFCYSEVTQSKYKSSVVRWHAELLILAFLAPIEENKLQKKYRKKFHFYFQKKCRIYFVKWEKNREIWKKM